MTEILRPIAAAAIVALGGLAVLPAAAQNWPTKPVKFVVPFPPGGSVDPLARLLGARLSDSLGQQFIIENKTGEIERWTKVVKDNNVRAD